MVGVFCVPFHNLKKDKSKIEQIIRQKSKNDTRIVDYKDIKI
jgi:hypothetical protein